MVKLGQECWHLKSMLSVSLCVYQDYGQLIKTTIFNWLVKHVVPRLSGRSGHVPQTMCVPQHVPDHLSRVPVLLQPGAQRLHLHHLLQYPTLQWPPAPPLQPCATPRPTQSHAPSASRRRHGRAAHPPVVRLAHCETTVTGAFFAPSKKKKD